METDSSFEIACLLGAINENVQALEGAVRGGYLRRTISVTVSGSWPGPDEGDVVITVGPATAADWR